MAAKRNQTTKQRRAFQNRAAREALVARRQAAARAAAAPTTGEGAEPTASPTGRLRGWLGGGSRSAGSRGPSRRPPRDRPSRPPSRLARVAPDRLAMFGLALAFIASAALLLVPFVPVEDGPQVGDAVEYESLLSRLGIVAVAIVAVPVGIAGLGAWAARPPRRPRLLIGAAIAQVAWVLFSGSAGLFFLFSAGALGLAAWQVRRSPAAGAETDSAAPEPSAP